VKPPDKVTSSGDAYKQTLKQRSVASTSSQHQKHPGSQDIVMTWTERNTGPRQAAADTFSKTTCEVAKYVGHFQAALGLNPHVRAEVPYGRYA